MARVPAVCNNCGSIFPSGIELINSFGITFRNVGAGPCPRCGGMGKILDGIYDGLGNTIRALVVSNRSVQELKVLRDALTTARDRKASREEISDAIKAQAPELQHIADALPQTRVELYAFVTMLVAIIAAVIALAALKPKGPTDAEIQAMVERAMAQACREPPTPAPTPQPQPQARNRAERRAGGRPLRPKHHK